MLFVLLENVHMYIQIYIHFHRVQKVPIACHVGSCHVLISRFVVSSYASYAS